MAAIPELSQAEHLCSPCQHGPDHVRGLAARGLPCRPLDDSSTLAAHTQLRSYQITFGAMARLRLYAMHFRQRLYLRLQAGQLLLQPSALAIQQLLRLLGCLQLRLHLCRPSLHMGDMRVRAKRALVSVLVRILWLFWSPFPGAPGLGSARSYANPTGAQEMESKTAISVQDASSAHA